MTPPQEPPLRDNTGSLRKDEQLTKKDRLAAALRENLHRRKAQRAGRANSAGSAAVSVAAAASAGFSGSGGSAACGGLGRFSMR